MMTARQTEVKKFFIHHKRKHGTWPKQYEAAEHLGISQPEVNRTLKRLRETGLDIGNRYTPAPISAIEEDPTDHTHDLAPGVQEAIDAAASCCCNRPEPATCPAPEMGTSRNTYTDIVAVKDVIVAFQDFAKTLSAARIGLLCDPPETKSPLAILTIVQEQVDKMLSTYDRPR